MGYIHLGAALFRCPLPSASTMKFNVRDLPRVTTPTPSTPSTTPKPSASFYSSSVFSRENVSLDLCSKYPRESRVELEIDATVQHILNTQELTFTPLQSTSDTSLVQSLGSLWYEERARCEKEQVEKDHLQPHRTLPRNRPAVTNTDDMKEKLKEYIQQESILLQTQPHQHKLKNRRVSLGTSNLAASSPSSSSSSSSSSTSSSSASPSITPSHLYLDSRVNQFPKVSIENPVLTNVTSATSKLAHHNSSTGITAPSSNDSLVPGKGHSVDVFKQTNTNTNVTHSSFRETCFAQSPYSHTQHPNTPLSNNPYLQFDSLVEHLVDMAYTSQCLPATPPKTVGAAVSSPFLKPPCKPSQGQAEDTPEVNSGEHEQEHPTAVDIQEGYSMEVDEGIVLSQVLVLLLFFNATSTFSHALSPRLLFME